MNFTKVLTVALLLNMIFIANSNDISNVKLTCHIKCRLACLGNPVCIAICLKNCPHSISSKALNCKLTCSNEHCSKFKEDEELMSSCLDECSTKDCT
ncbi:hypothetical protein RND71_022572 [Anisodus tanguticus]|uniref:Uncharacterized protein n=1 Tax=Anisodus tanguticus TaxID=243964 RepID=A0AAE1V688_9SOLA|nr:hypothetical protein RND71_022572 [Anisodus tanguticus]